jgi:Ca2+-binding EF-hand superfamily protein
MEGAPRRRRDVVPVHATHWLIATQDFTPLEFEEIVDLFKEFDKDKSGYIDEEELCEMMRALEMDHSLAKAKEVLTQRLQ